jgi:predicted DsbA family dithiol-disulfide isomerase
MSRVTQTCRAIVARISLRSVRCVIYYDFISTESFILDTVARELPSTDELSWRGVQSDPTLPVPSAAFERRARERVEMDVSEAQRALPGVTLRVPRGHANTRAALQAVASVERMHAVRANEFRSRLFREYWQLGADLGDRTVISRVATDAGVPPWVELEHQAAQAQQVAWELEWRTERLGGVPRVIRADGQILWSARDASAVRSFLTAQ